MSSILRKLRPAIENYGAPGLALPASFTNVFICLCNVLLYSYANQCLEYMLKRICTNIHVN